MYLKNKHDLELFSEDEYIEYGINIASKERISRQKTYRLRKEAGSFVPDTYMVQNIDTIYQLYVLPDYPYDYRPFLISSFVQPGDYFDGYMDEKSPYISCLARPNEKVEVVAGVRYVNLKQQIDEYVKDTDNPDSALRNNIILSTSELEVNEFFPSISVKYTYNDKNVFDIAASKTYIMPDFREVSGIYNSPYEPATIIGNPDLVNTTMYNLDLKYSYFITEDEYIKSGIFYKYMDKPIEDVQLLAPSLPIYSYVNTDMATLYGFEIDWRKNFDFINTNWANYYIAGNFSYNFSEVSLTDDQKTMFTSDNRPLQGLSPYVFNMTLGYENEKRSVSLNTNYMSERIRKVGVIDGYISLQDQYETPPILMDLVWIEQVKTKYPFELKFKVGNILDDEVVWKEGDRITREFKMGPTFDISATYKY
jgi:outer membrane receptor protein involved in Fe transport